MIAGQVQTNDLHKALGLCAPIAPTATRASLPSTTQVKLTIGNGVLVLETTDTEQLMQVSMPCIHEGKDTGSVLVPARELKDLVKGLDKKQRVSLIELDKDVQVVQGGTTLLLKAMNAEEFPPNLSREWMPAARVRADRFLHSITRALDSVATEDSRPVLAAAKLELKKTMRMVSADGFVLSVHTDEEIPQPAPEGYATETTLIPVGTLKTLKRTLKAVAGELLIERSVDGRVLQITTRHASNNTKLWQTSLVQGTFPQYAKLIPDHRAHIATFFELGTEAHLAAIKPLLPIAKAGSGTLRMIVSTRGIRWVVSDGESGKDSDAFVECKTEIGRDGDGEPQHTKVALNATFVKELLTTFKGESVKGGITTPSSPVMLNASGTTRVIMPMFVQW